MPAPIQSSGVWHVVKRMSTARIAVLAIAPARGRVAAHLAGGADHEPAQATGNRLTRRSKRRNLDGRLAGSSPHAPFTILRGARYGVPSQVTAQK